MPFNTYFIVLNIDKNSISNIFIVGILFDLLYGRFLFTIFIFIVYFMVRSLKIKNRYYWIKNIILYLLFCYFMNII